jgi:outer membrane immunogenic protein
MKRIGVAAAFSLVLSGSGWAADLAPVPHAPARYAPAPIYDWTGFYVGGNAGYGWGTVNTSNNSATTDGALFGLGGPAGTFPGPDRHFNVSGGFGGAQIGYNFQSAAWVIGLEADFQGSSLRATDAFVTSGVQYNTNGKIDWFGTVRGRVGYAFDRILPFVTGGLAYDHTKTDLTVQYVGLPAAGPAFSSSNTDTNFGWTVGAGIEAALSANWTAKIEYLHMNFGRSGTDFTFAAADGSTVHSDVKTQVNLIRGGVNYKF